MNLSAPFLVANRFKRYALNLYSVKFNALYSNRFVSELLFQRVPLNPTFFDRDSSQSCKIFELFSLLMTEPEAAAPKPSPAGDLTPEFLETLKGYLTAHEYTMLELLGKGGFSVIFRVHSWKYKSDFAAKITYLSSKSRRIAENEEMALHSLNHPNIIKLYESFHEGNFSFLILELCTNQTLKHMIKHSPSGNYWHMARQLCDALLYIHDKGFAHRDIKPSNVLIDTYGRPRIADFGLCIKCEPGTKVREYVGSPQYMAPEIVKRMSYCPYSADVWAMGLTLYEMAMGMIEWPANPQMFNEMITSGSINISHKTPRPVLRIITKMIDAHPDGRFTMRQVCQLLDKVSAENKPAQQQGLPPKKPSFLRLTTDRTSLAHRSYVKDQHPAFRPIVQGIVARRRVQSNSPTPQTFMRPII